jgi:hypothetical protein
LREMDRVALAVSHTFEGVEAGIAKWL